MRKPWQPFKTLNGNMVKLFRYKLEAEECDYTTQSGLPITSASQRWARLWKPRDWITGSRLSMQACRTKAKRRGLRTACTEQSTEKTVSRKPYRNRQDKVHTPIRVLSANIPNGSSHTYTDISLRHELIEPFWKQHPLETKVEIELKFLQKELNQQ